jgi:hypothetical protein
VQEDCEFKVSLGYIVRSYSKKKKSFLESTFIATFGEKLCTSYSLPGSFYLFPLPESRGCAISFFPTIILVISWSPVPLRDATCHVCVLYEAVEYVNCMVRVWRMLGHSPVWPWLGAQRTDNLFS